jgi:hypothetical protein
MALYHYLLFEANRQHWATPFKVSTQMIQARLNTSKQNVMKAREALTKRGLISYSKGEGKGKPALYTLYLGTSDDSKAPSQQLSPPLTQKLSHELTQPLSATLTPTLPLSNIKDEKTEYVEKKEVGSPSPPSSDKDVLTLSELRMKLLNDDPWLLDLSKRLTKIGVILSDNELKGKIIEFFDEQQKKGITHKEETDCRKYVFNWIRYYNKNNKHGQDSGNEGKTGQTEISANRPADYKGAC